MASSTPDCFLGLFSATTGLVLSAVERRAGFFGKAAALLGGLTWSLSTIFVMPLIVKDGLEPRQALSSSALLFKRTWGENFLANEAFGLPTMLTLLIFGAFPALAVLVLTIQGTIAFPLNFAIGVLALVIAVGIGSYFSTLRTIFRIALLRFAENGDYIGPYEADFVQGTYWKP